MRAWVAVLAALLIAVQVVRNAAVGAFAATDPAASTRIWSGHPASEIGLAMTDIARASRARRPVPQSAFALMNDVAAKAPLAPEPFLVRGVRAQLAGDEAKAQQAFEAAQWRDPRSLAAAYFLADRYLRSGDVSHGLTEAGALARLSPGGSAAVIPYLSQYAKDPGAWPALRAMFRANPQLAQPVLAALAAKRETVPAVLALADPRDVGNPAWLGPLVDTLIRDGDYAKARAVWARTAGRGSTVRELVHDTAFADRTAPPPFNWDLATSTVGLAERQAGGRLHIVYYGDEDGNLASQLLLLPPGTYRLSMQLLGDPGRAHALTWSLWCDKGAQPLGSVTLDSAGGRGWQFQVPSGCPAQWLKLSGTSADMPQQSDVSIGRLKIEKAANHA